jgi:hypothetical protein
MMRHPPPVFTTPKNEQARWRGNINVKHDEDNLPGTQGPLVYVGPPFDPYIEEGELVRNGYVGIYLLDGDPQWTASDLAIWASHSAMVTLQSCASLSGQIFPELLREKSPYR